MHAGKRNGAALDSDTAPLIHKEGSGRFREQQRALKHFPGIVTGLEQKLCHTLGCLANYTLYCLLSAGFSGRGDFDGATGMKKKGITFPQREECHKLCQPGIYSAPPHSPPAPHTHTHTQVHFPSSRCTSSGFGSTAYSLCKA